LKPPQRAGREGIAVSTVFFMFATKWSSHY